MPLYLGHRTAELLLDRPFVEPLVPSLDQGLEYCSANREAFKDVDLSALEGIPQPYDVLVSSADEIRRWNGIRCHLCTAPLPSGSFIEISENIFVASSSLCLIQRAQELTLPQTITLGERLCGTFALDRSKASGIRRRRPLLELDELRSFMNRCSHLKGLERAQRATSLMLEQSASPMETISRLVFCLPRRLSGFGLPLPQMNYELTLTPAAQKLVDKQYIRIDLYWREFGFGLEYQGKYAHSSHTSIAKDIARQLAAERTGAELQMVTIEQLRNQAQRVEIARKIASRLGVPFSIDQAFLLANQRLVDDLIQTVIT